MTAEYIESLLLPIVAVGGVVVGMIIKHLTIIDNQYIPLILGVLGAIAGCFVMNELSIEAIVCGSFSALAGTGMHQCGKVLSSVFNPKNSSSNNGPTPVEEIFRGDR